MRVQWADVTSLLNLTTMVQKLQAQAERKHLLRCLIESVTLDRFTLPEHSPIHIRWHTGATDILTVKRPPPGRQPNHALHDHIGKLAQHHPDDEIVCILNNEGVTTGDG